MGADDCDTGITALMGAAQKGHTEILIELLQNGVDANVTSSNGERLGAEVSVMRHLLNFDHAI
jgi:ankyrin repeat protein